MRVLPGRTLPFGAPPINSARGIVRMRRRSVRLWKGEHDMRTILALIAGTILMTGIAAAQERTRSLVTYDNVTIDLIAEGRGRPIVLLPSRGRDSEDYDEVAAGLAKQGFPVLRPPPRGVHASKGPLQDNTLPYLARHVATRIPA